MTTSVWLFKYCVLLSRENLTLICKFVQAIEEVCPLKEPP